MTEPRRTRAPELIVQGLTLAAPWSAAIRFGGKNLENRTWHPYGLKNNWLLLHGGKAYGTPDKLCDMAIEWYYICESAPHLATTICHAPTVIDWEYQNGVRTAVFDRRELVRVGIALKDRIPQGFFGICKIQGTVKLPPGLSPERYPKWYVPGQVGWRLDKVTCWPDPIAARGSQGMFPVTEDAYPGVLAQVKMLYQAQTGRELL